MPNSTWKAGQNDKFTGASRKEIRSLMGTVVDPEWTINLHEKDFSGEVVSGDFPEFFDAREHWPECAKVINHVRD
jgi:cathepsin B